MSLAIFLTDWTDVDRAAHELARCLGVVPAGTAVADVKWVYWSNNGFGTELVALLDRLTLVGFLEKRNEPDCQYRLAPRFHGRLGLEEIRERFSPTSPVALKLVVLRCTDLASSRRFYEALGVVLALEQHGSGPQHYSALLGETVLELYPANAPVAPIRIGLSVADVRAAVTAVGALADCVLRFDPESAPPAALVRDPDGNKIELTLRTD
jgi:lactoylglutathione lyase